MALRIATKTIEIRNLWSFEAYTAMVAILPTLPKRDIAQVIRARLPVDLILKT